MRLGSNSSAPRKENSLGRKFLRNEAINLYQSRKWCNVWMCVLINEQNFEYEPGRFSCRILDSETWESDNKLVLIQVQKSPLQFSWILFYFRASKSELISSFSDLFALLNKFWSQKLLVVPEAAPSVQLKTSDWPRESKTTFLNPGQEPRGMEEISWLSPPGSYSTSRGTTSSPPSHARSGLTLISLNHPDQLCSGRRSRTPGTWTGPSVCMQNPAKLKIKDWRSGLRRDD